MTWLEMSRTPEERPAGWGVGDCLWSPRLKENGAKWGFWQTMLEVLKGDVVFHLCGGSGEAKFTGFSTAISEAYPIEVGPDGAVEDYRVDLADFTPLSDSIPVAEVFQHKAEPLKAYFITNKQRANEERERLFYVWQNEKLQCLNGAYLSMLNTALLKIIFGLQITQTPSQVSVPSTAATGTVLRNAAFRIGQNLFSSNVRQNFEHRCCFPGCVVADDRFLVGSHIARWSEVPELRGRTDNGLCLCLFHDRAFEIGAFTLDRRHKVCIAEEIENSWLLHELAPAGALPIRAPVSINPSIRALKLHWTQHGFQLE